MPARESETESDSNAFVFDLAQQVADQETLKNLNLQPEDKINGER